MQASATLNTAPARGFTLIEVMIVVAIVAILSAIALPSYTEYIRRGNRAEARAGLLQAAQWMRAAGRSGSIVTILCDSGERYAHSYYDPEWYVRQGIEVTEADAQVEAALRGEGLPDLPMSSLEPV